MLIKNCLLFKSVGMKYHHHPFLQYTLPWRYLYSYSKMMPNHNLTHFLLNNSVILFCITFITLIVASVEQSSHIINSKSAKSLIQYGINCSWQYLFSIMYTHYYRNLRHPSNLTHLPLLFYINYFYVQSVF